MRRAIAVGVATILLGVPETLAANPWPPESGQQSPSLSEAAPRPWKDAGADGYTVVVIAAGAVIAVIAANVLTGGMLTPILTFGAPAATATAAAAIVPSASAAGVGMGPLLVAVPAAALATMGMMMPAATIGAAAPTAGAAAATGAAGSAAGGAGLGMGIGATVEMSFMVAAPTALASVGQPLHEALRDGYTTPSVLFAAFGESAKRAGTMILESGAYIGSAASSWWSGR
jgi:hypothetical protein